MSLDFKTARIVALFVEALLFGVFSVIYGQAMWVLVYKVKREVGHFSRRNKVLIATCTALYILAIFTLALNLQHVLEGFVAHGRVLDDIKAYFVTFDALSAIQKLAAVVASLLADSVLVYRVYLVCGRRRAAVILPGVVLVVCAAMAVRGDVALFPQTHSDPHTVLVWMSASLMLSVATNVLCSAIIAGRLFWAFRKKPRNGSAAYGPSPWQVMEVVIESAMVTAAAQLCFFATFVAGSNAWYILLNMMTSLIGINFTLIIVRLSQARKPKAEEVCLTSIVISQGETTAATMTTVREEYDIEGMPPVELHLPVCGVTRSEPQKSPLEGADSVASLPK